MVDRTHAATRAALRKYLGIKEGGSIAHSTANTMMIKAEDEAALVIEVPAAAAAPGAAGDQGGRRSRRAEVEVAEEAEAVGREERRSKRRRKSSEVKGLQV